MELGQADKGHRRRITLDRKIMSDPKILVALDYHDKNKALALAIHDTVMNNKMADFRGNLPKEAKIQSALYDVLKDKDKVKEIFEIIKEQKEY